MRVSKNKNSGFISNSQLLEGFRNRSVRSLNHSNRSQTTISLIQKKRFDQNQEPNSVKHSIPHSPVKHTQLMQRQRSIASSNGKPEESANQNNKPTKQEAALLAKIQQLYMEKNKLKKEKKLLEQKCKQQSIKYEATEEKLKKENQKLHRLVIKQSQLLTSQGVNESDEELRRIILAQAIALEQNSGRRRSKKLL